jgi:hypothetical protein
VPVPQEPPTPEPLLCGFCDAPATATCPRCGTLYCPAHGGGTCDACSDPATGLPSALVFRGAVAAFVIGTLAALWLLLAPPRLPGEQAPPAEATPPAATTGGGQGPSQGQTPPAPAASPAGTGAPGTSPAAVPQTHPIRAGDTLGAIAAQYSTTVDAIRAANPGLSETALQIGQEIVIPSGR